jgi:hypothetical protein
MRGGWFCGSGSKVSTASLQDLNYSSGGGGRTPKDMAKCGGVGAGHRRPDGSGVGASRGAKQADPGLGRGLGVALSFAFVKKLLKGPDLSSSWTSWWRRVRTKRPSGTSSPTA